MTVFSQLARLPFADIRAAVILQPRVSGTPTPYYVTDAAALFTEPTDDPPDTGFRNVLMSGWRIDRSISDPGALFGPSRAAVGSLTLNLADGYLSDWEDLGWDGAAVEIRLGGAIKADGSVYPFADFETVFTGICGDPVPGEGSTIEIPITSADALIDQLVTETYGGWGGAYRIESGDTATTADDAALDVTAVTIEWIGVCNALPASGGALLRRGATGDYGLRLTPAGLLQFVYDSGTAISTSYTVTAGQRLYAAASVGTVGGVITAKVYAGSTPENVAEVLSETLPSFPMTSGGLNFVGTGWGFDLWEARLWSVARSEDDIVDGFRSPILDAANEADVIEAWKCGDGTGSTISGEKGLLDITVSGGDWVSSLEGDDPQQFPGGPMGQSKPDLFGPASEVLLTLVDSQRGEYQWSRSASQDLLRVKSRGVPLVPDETIAEANPGDMIFTAPDRITLNPASGLSFHRLIQFQDSPPRDGQYIDIAGTASNDQIGIECFAVDADGLGLTTASVIVNETGPGTAVVSTFADSIQYTYDLARSIITVPTPLDGELTATAVGRLSNGDYTAADWVEYLTGAAPNTDDLAFNPRIGWHVRRGQSITGRDVISAIQRSIVGWVLESRAGSWRMGNYSDPDPNATPDVAVVFSPIFEVDAALSAPVIARGVSISPRRTVIPPWSVSLAYAPTWHTQQASALAGSVSPADRALLSEPWRVLDRSRAQTLADYPTSTPLPRPVETWIASQSDAIEAAARLRDFLCVKRRWWPIDAAGAGLSTIELYAHALVEHPDPTKGLAGGVHCRVIRVTEDSGRDVVGLEVYR